MEKPSLDKAKAGAMRFNTDSLVLEIYDGNQWVQVVADSPELITNGTRACRVGGQTPSTPFGINTIDFFNMSTTGNASDFGDLNVYRASSGQGFASRTRGFAAGGYNSSLGGYINNIDFFTIDSKGNASDFGDMVAAKQGIGAFASTTRGVINTGSPAPSNVIQYVVMATTGNARDFGDLSVARTYARGLASKTRGFGCGGYAPNSSNSSNVIDYITIATLGNSSDFGDVSYGARGSLLTSSNATRGIICGGSPETTATINFVTLATLGDSLEFGDLTRSRRDGAAMTSPTRFVAAGGANPSSPSGTDEIEFITIATLGNGTDFGDLTDPYFETAGLSNGHGGL